MLVSMKIHQILQWRVTGNIIVDIGFSGDDIEHRSVFSVEVRESHASILSPARLVMPSIHTEDFYATCCCSLSGNAMPSFSSSFSDCSSRATPLGRVVPVDSLDASLTLLSGRPHSNCGKRLHRAGDVVFGSFRGCRQRLVLETWFQLTATAATTGPPPPSWFAT